MMKRILSFLLVAIAVTFPVAAQKELKALRAFVKAKNTSEAMKEVARLEKDSICRFMPKLYELAAKAQSKQMQLYVDACKRVSDYSVYEARGVFRMRCKIDGVQQMSRQVDKEDVSTYLAYKDIYVLAAKYYKDVLTEGVNNTMSRTR